MPASMRSYQTTLAPALLSLVLLVPLHLLLEVWIRIEAIAAAVLLVVSLLTQWRKWDVHALLALGSGWLCALAMPDLNFSALAFVALVPLLIAIARAESWGIAACHGVMTGAMLAYISLSWGGNTFAAYSEVSRVTGLLMFLPFTVLLTLKIPVFAALAWVAMRRPRLSPLISLPAFFAALETAKFEMYPWYLGVSQHSRLHLPQIIDLVGMPGLSFLIVLVNVAIYQCGVAVWKKRLMAATVPLGVAIIAIVGSYAYGEIRIRAVASAETDARTIAVALIQPNSPPKVLRADIATEDRICATLASLAEAAAHKLKPDLLVFAEGSAPMGFQVRMRPRICDTYTSIAQRLNAPVLTDNNHVRANAPRPLVWRGAILLSPQGEVIGEYLKRRLVPFGEFIPLEAVFPSLRKLFPYTITYQAGVDMPDLRVGRVSVAPQICFEIIYPAAVRSYVARGARLLINLANDSWYRSRKQAAQHLAVSVFRSIENRVPMVRASNTGISAYVDAAGRIRGETSGIGVAWADSREVSLLQLGSFYRQFGDVFGWICVALTSLYLGAMFRARNRPSSPTDLAG